MYRLLLVVLILVALAASIVFAVPARMVPHSDPVFLTGLEDGPALPILLPPARPIPRSLDDWTPNSIVDTVGWTWYENQTNGTHGKQIGVDADGWVHHVWTNGLTEGAAGVRHIYYNVWDPGTQDFALGGGVQVDASTRAGFCNVVVEPDSGWAYPVFHQVLSGTAAHTAAAIDFLPRTGAFTNSEIPHIPGDGDVIWPHASLDRNGELHTVSTANPLAGEYYAKGTPIITDGYGENITWGNGFILWDPADFITIDVAASPVSDKVVTAWLNPNDAAIGDNNIYIKVSTDAGDTWGAAQNITNHAVIDPTCCTQFGDPDFCNGDTLRPWIDLSVLIDRDDNIHVAWSTSGWFYHDTTCAPQTPGVIYSMIFHWDEASNLYGRVADGWYLPTDLCFTGMSVNQLMCHRPSLAQDSSTGYLYCAYQLYDSVLVGSECCWPQADAWVSVSTDGGVHWAVGTNVTSTVGVPGNDRSERDITIAPWVTGGNLHMQYVVDHSVGMAIQSECVWAQCEVVYQRIPVGDIAETPLLEPYPLRADSTGFPPLGVRDLPGPLPKSFALYQNYPNPFNPNTNIQFDLANAGSISLRVFDITGREVAVLLNNERIGAGAHVIEFNAADLPSGVYFYRLDAQGQQFTRKMMLIK